LLAITGGTDLPSGIGRAFLAPAAPPKNSRYLFDRRDHELIRIVNSVRKGGDENAHTRKLYYPYFHPDGIKELAESKGLRIAYALVHLLSSLEGGGVDERLNALRSLRKEVLDTAEGPMPRNTARVLLQIMKELVRAQSDYRRQLELAHDFRTTASGKPRTVRRQLKQYHLLEMPEGWNQIAFDDHVHDANTKGRKSSTHLIMDSWIKGIRRLRIIHYNFIEPRFAAELLEAAAIMEIDVRIGIEFYARFRNKYVQLIWAPRGFSDAAAFLCFLADSQSAGLMEAGRQTSQFQQRYVMALLDRFNTTHRLEINRNLEIELPPIDADAFLNFVGIGQKSKLHLAKYIQDQILHHLHTKVDALRQEMITASRERREALTRWVDTMNRLDLETMVDTYLEPDRNPEIANPEEPGDPLQVPELLRMSPFELLNRLAQLATGYRVTLNLSNVKVHEVLELLYDCQGMITRLELFNLKDQTAGKTDHIIDISRLQQAINQGNVISLKSVIRDIRDNYSNSFGADPDQTEKLTAILYDIATLSSFYTGKPIKARMGSDSTGRTPRMHGMGLVLKDTLPRKVQRQVERDVGANLRAVIPIKMVAYRHVLYIPKRATRPFNRLLVRLADRFETLSALGYARQKGWRVEATATHVNPQGNVVTLGGMQREVLNQLYLTSPRNKTHRRRFLWRDLNSHLKNSLKVLFGFVPAFATFALTKDWWVLAYLGAFIWFGITGLRNILQSVLGGGGIRRSPLLNWNDLISWTRITDSLMYTGFSVPLLDYVVKTVLLDRGFSVTTATHPMLLYTVMALANGIYLSSHNMIRGLSKAAVYGNFFRSVLSIPIAIGLNTGIGAILSTYGVIPTAPILQKWAAVISKAASDVVAGIIEGTSDRFNNIHMRLRACKIKFNELLDIYARLELCFPDVRSGRVLDYSSRNAKNTSAEARDLEKIIMVHALDLLYFWMYQPRARYALKHFISTLSEEERHILVSSQFILQRHREVSQMFIDGMVGSNFPRPLSFYLSRYEEYLEAVKQLVWRYEATPADQAAAPQG
jgi:hypothetical protein